VGCRGSEEIVLWDGKGFRREEQVGLLALSVVFSGELIGLELLSGE
jgi:hypothetical protein